MKIDELLKRIENINIGDNEEREVAERLVQLSNDKVYRDAYYIMLKDKRVYGFDEYKNLLESNKVSPNDAYVFIKNAHFDLAEEATYLYPFLANTILLSEAYLSKLGFYSDSNEYRIAPANGLKYAGIVHSFRNIRSIVIEIACIDTVASMINLKETTEFVLGTETSELSSEELKYISPDDVNKVVQQLSLFVLLSMPVSSVVQHNGQEKT